MKTMFAIKNRTTGLYQGTSGGVGATAEYRREYASKLEALHALLDVRAADPVETFVLVRIREECATVSEQGQLYFVYDEHDCSADACTRYVRFSESARDHWVWCSEAERAELPKASALALRDKVRTRGGATCCVHIALVAEGVPVKRSLYYRVVERFIESGFPVDPEIDTRAKLLCDEIESRLR
jgi:hypothetical protein